MFVPCLHEGEICGRVVFGGKWLGLTLEGVILCLSCVEVDADFIIQAIEHNINYTVFSIFVSFLLRILINFIVLNLLSASSNCWYINKLPNSVT